MIILRRGQTDTKTQTHQASSLKADRETEAHYESSLTSGQTGTETEKNNHEQNPHLQDSPLTNPVRVSSLYLNHGDYFIRVRLEKGVVLQLPKLVHDL